MISPILVSGKVEGFLVMDALDQEQRKRLILAEANYLNFISQMSDLIANKLALNVTISKLSAIINAVHEGIVAIDETGTITSWNEYATMALNAPDEYLEGKKVWEIFKLNLSSINHVLEYGQDIVHIEIKSVDALGASTYIGDVHPIFSQEKIIGALLVFREMKEVHKLYSRYLSGGSDFAFDGLIGDSSTMKALKEKALRVTRAIPRC